MEYSVRTVATLTIARFKDNDPMCKEKCNPISKCNPIDNPECFEVVYSGPVSPKQ